MPEIRLTTYCQCLWYMYTVKLNVSNITFCILYFMLADIDKIRRDVENLRNEYRMQTYITRRNFQEFKCSANEHTDMLYEGFEEMNTSNKDNYITLQEKVHTGITDVIDGTKKELEKVEKKIDNEFERLIAELKEQDAILNSLSNILN